MNSTIFYDMNKSKMILQYVVSVILMTIFFNATAFGQASTFSGSGNWNTVARWSNGIPTSGTAVTIANGANCTVNVAAVAASLTFAAGNTASIVTISGTNSLTVSGAVTMNAGTGAGDNRTIAVGTGSLDVGSVSMVNTGNDGRDCIISASTGTITIAGDLAMAGTFLRNHVDITGAGTINIGGNVDNGSGAVGGGFTTPPVTSIINLNGSTAQTVFLYGGNSALGILKINNTVGVTSGSTFSTSTLTIGDITPNSIFSVGNFAITVSANLVVKGALNGTGAVTLSGTNATIDGTGTISAPTTISANHTINATANLTISGTMTINNTFVVTNNGTVTASNLGAGTGTWTQGNNSTLNYSNAAAITPTLNATNTGNTVNYNNGAQTAKVTTYVNLTLSGSGAKTFATTPTVNGILSLEGAATVTVTTGVVTYGTNATLQYKSSNARTASAEEWITPFAATGGVIIDSVGIVTLDNAKVFNLSVPLTINSSATLATNDLDVEFRGNFVNSGGTFTAGSSNITIGGNGAQSIAGFTTTGTVTMTKTGNTATLQGALSSGDLILNGTGGTLNLGTGLTHSVANGTLTNGTLNLSSSTINLSGALSGTGTLIGSTGTLNLAGDWTHSGTFTQNTCTVNYNGTLADQVVRGGITYYNLQISNGSTKLFQVGNVTVSNILTLNSGVLRIGDYNLILSNTGTGAIAGSPFSVSKMIQTDGTGYVQKTGAAAGSGINILYPIGSGGYYNPLDLTSGFTVTGVSTGNIQIRAIVANQGANALGKYWNLTVNGYTGTITSTIRFTYNAADVHGAQSQYDTWFYNGSSWISAPGTHTSLGTNPFGSNVSGVTAASISGRWSAGSTAPATSVSFYSYQSGNWSDATSWTSDPSGTQWVNPGIPGNSDNITILNGRTISIVANSKQVSTLTINQGGILDVASTTGHNFGTVTGQGKLMLGSNTFPSGTFTSFVSSGGGTIEYYNLNNVSISTGQLIYNNLIISNYSSGANGTILNNGSNPTTYTINGNFSIKNFSIGSQTVYFGNSTPSDNLINMTVYGNFTVDANCNVRVNNSATARAIPNVSDGGATAYLVHTLSLYGNLTNNGSVRFTGLPSPVNNAYYTLTTTAYSGTNYGDVQVIFKGATNNTVTCNGVTDFFRLIVEKGTDKTYVVEVSSSNTNNFALYAPNNQGNNTFDGGTEGYGYGAYYKALFIHYGTLKLNENINIPSLTEGGQDFNIIPTAGLWINGATVVPTVTGLNGTGYQAATLYGMLRISAGQLSTGDAAGIVLGTAGTPVIRIEGTGILDASQVWTATGGSNQMSYIQTGGTANFRLQGETQPGPMLNLSNTNAVFIMSGGTINFTDNTYVGGGTNFNIIDIQCQAGNYEITGGTLNFNLPSSGTTYTANATIPLYNLNISRRTGAGTVIVQWNTPGSVLNVLNDLTIGSNTTLNLNTSSIDLSVGGNFTIAAGGTYTPATGAANVTTFNGTGAQAFTNIGTITGNALNNLTITNSSLTSIISNDITVNRALTINNSATLNDSGRYVYVLGNIVNKGTHRGQLSTGGIRLTGTTAQTIDGNGTGTFYNLLIDKPNTTGVTLIGNVSVVGNLRLITNANFNIGSRTLSLGANSNVYTSLTGTTQTYNNTHMVYTNGLPSDGGVSKTFDAAHKTFLYPIGTGTSYRPAQIQFAIDPTQYGSITIRSVLSAHPLVQAAGKAITLYWKTTSSGFSGIQSNSINQIYYYNSTDAPTPADEVNYIPATYSAPSWTQINDISKVSETLTPREIRFDIVNYLDGEYTGGTSAAFAGLATYFSNSNNANVISAGGADWNAANTWCTGSHTGTPVGALADNMSNASFIIGDGSPTTHTINISGVHQISTGNITIRSDGKLDIGTTTGHNFGAVISDISGNGILRIRSSNYFPRGDWGDFLGSTGGTVEYYQTTSGSLNLPTTYLLPGGGSSNITSYYNLTTLPYYTSNIILPNTNLTIYNNFTVGYSAGGGTTGCMTQINSAATSTLEVRGNIAVNQYGILQFMNGFVQNVIADGSISVASGGAFQVSAAGTAVANSLTVYGSITNNGTLDLNPNTRYCNLIFTGTSNKLLTSTSTPTMTRLYNIGVDIGTSRDSVVNVNIDPTGFQMGTGGLNLLNGTFRLTTNVTMNLSTGSFIIPGTACLSANGGIFNIATGAAGADLNLNGRLEVLAGSVNVGPVISSGSANAFNIVYASAGIPEIIVSGGTLNVFTQIRRGIVVTSGSLNYTQTSGTVTVGAKNANTARAAFEVLNTASKFVMSNGTIIIANSVSNTAPYDMTLEADISTVTGGTIQFGLSGITPNQTLFHFQSASTLKNLTLEASTNARAIQQIHPLSLSGNLIIGGASSYYNPNGLDVSIGGNLTNNNTEAASNGLNVGGYRTQIVSQNTVFNGTGSQTITGTASNRTNFAKLQIAGSSGRTVFLSSGSGNITVNGDLTLSNGTLNDGANTVYLLNNVTNDAIHYSPNATTGGFLFTGTANQVIAGNGTFGNIEINNSGNGLNMTNNAIINGQLKFTNGFLYINDFALTLGVSSTIAGTVNASNMIVMNGASSDQGVTKIFPSGAMSFTFPIGNNGKYTPSTFNFSSNSNTGATIKVIPVNSIHPTVNPSNYTNFLNYYWSVSTTGFSSAYSVTHTYQYITTDVQASPANIERYNNNTSQWSPVTGTISSPTFFFTSASLLDGSYTIGDVFNDLPVLTSKQSGNWSDPNTWDLVTIPNGNPVIIRSQDSVALASNGAFASSVTIHGVLDAKNTTFHSLGQVSGDGKIRILNTGDGMFVFPAGSYDSLFTNQASTVEFYGNTNGTLPLDVGSVTKPYQQVIFSGTGIKYISSVDMKVIGNITFISGSKLDNTLYNKDVYLVGHWVDGNTSVSGFAPGTGTVRFSGTTLQNLIMANNSMTETFYNLAINNAAGVTIQTGNIDVENQLTLTLGNINTNGTNKLTINNTGTNAVVGGGVNSFVNGPLRKKITNGSNFRFPVGDAVSSSRNRIGYVSVTSTSTSGTQIWTAQFFDKNPTTDGYDVANLALPLNWLAANEYWNVVGPSGGSANIILTWDSYTGMSSSPTIRAQTRLAEWNTPVASKWNNVGQVVSDFGLDSGTVASSVLIALDNHFFTIGSGSVSVGGLVWAIQTGLWNTPSIWSGGYVPGPNDTVAIGNPYPNPVTVTLDVAPTILSLRLTSGGTFADGGNTINVTGNLLMNGLWSGSGALNWTTNDDTLDGTGTVSGTPTLLVNGNKVIRSSVNATLYRIQIESGNSISNNGTIQATRLIGSGISSTWVNEINSVLRIADTLLTTGTLTATANNNTVTYNGTGNQSVKLTNYFNLTLSGSRGTNSITMPSSTLNVAGAFSPTATFTSGNYITTSNTIDFNGSGAQTIPAFNYNNLTISSSRTSNTVTLVSGDTIKIAGLFSPTATFTSGGYSKTGNWIAFNGTNAQTIPAFNYNSLKISGGRSSNNVTLASSDTIGVADSLSLQASFTSGNYVVTGSKIAYNGIGTQTIVPFRYNNLSISGSRGANNVKFAPSDTVKIAEVFAVSSSFSGGGLIFTNSTIDFNGTGAQTIPAFNYTNLKISGSRTTNNVILANSGIIGVAGLFAPSATFSGGVYVSSGSTINYNGSGAQTIPAFSYNNLSISGSRTTYTVTLANSGTISVAGTFSNSASFSSGGFVNTGSTVDYSSTGAQTISAFNYNNLTISGSRTSNNVTLAGSDTIGIAGIFTNSATFSGGNFVSTNSTMSFNGSGAQTVPAFLYYNLKTATGGTKTAGGTLRVYGDMIIGAGSTLNVSSTTDTIYGNWNNNGTFTPSTSTIIFAGSGISTITGATTYNNLVANKNLQNTMITLNNNINVANLAMTVGMLTTGSNAVTITSTRTGNGIILGTITRTHTFIAGTPYAFEGPNNILNFNAGGTLPTSVTVFVDTVSPGVNTYMEPIKRYYTISQTGGSGFTYTMRLHYQNSEVISPNIKSSLKIWERTSTGPDVWVRYGNTSIDTVAYWVEMTGITNVGTWSLSSRTVPNIVLTMASNKVNPVPGDTVLYTIDYNNTGDGSATNTIVSASTPFHTAYTVNSVIVNGISKTDASDADGVVVSSGNITVNLGTIIGTIGPGINGTITYKVVIN